MTTEQKKLIETPQKLNEEKRPLIETLGERLAVYDGDKYLFSLAITSEFEKDDLAYNRAAMIDAIHEHLIEKSMELRDRLQSSALYAKTPEVPSEVKAPAEKEKDAGEWDHLDRGGKMYARVVQRPNELIVLPVESLAIKSDDGVFQSFLVPRVLEKMKQSHGLDYRLEAKNGILAAIVIKGNLNADITKKLLNPIGWSLERAASREEKPEKKPDVATETVRAKFPADLQQLLSFDVEGKFVVMKPRQFLGSENFSRIATITRENGGEYVSAGKQSHFRVPVG